MTNPKINFETRFPDHRASEWENIADEMMEIASRGGEESYHYVCGAVFATKYVTSGQIDILRAVYEDQGLDEVSDEP